jgi:hypothetical protein
MDALRIMRLLHKDKYFGMNRLEYSARLPAIAPDDGI